MLLPLLQLLKVYQLSNKLVHPNNVHYQDDMHQQPSQALQYANNTLQQVCWEML